MRFLHWNRLPVVDAVRTLQTSFPPDFSAAGVPELFGGRSR